jgi:hypothetical protein
MNDLAGAIWLAPGRAMPHGLRSSRRAWAARMAPGRPAQQLPGLLAGLHSLCGESHRMASRLALQAADPGWHSGAVDVAAVLQLETAREHVRRIALDWPRLLEPLVLGTPIQADALACLRTCPLISRSGEATPWPAVRRWLREEVLQMAPETWLRAWQACGADWLDDWSRRHTGWLPWLLRLARAAELDLPEVRERSLRPQAQVTHLRHLGQAMAEHEAFSRRPGWQGGPACTGPWTRHHLSEPPQPWTTWSLLGSRLAELVRLCLPDVPGERGAGWLSWGSLNVGPRQGLAWVEMARGLLIHQVALQAPVAGEPLRVMSCQVLAPTEWNFHPEGLVAQTLSRLPVALRDLSARVHLLMAAFDPCVPFHIDARIGHDSGMETTHA